MHFYFPKFKINNEYCQDIPIEDFSNQHFDQNKDHRLKEVIILLSTPRSGSTLFCEHIHNLEICTMHEYFQPYQYMPILSRRWGAYVDDYHVDFEKYCKLLIKFRTSKGGILGINSHGEHLNFLLAFLQLYPQLKYKFIFLKRENILEQAISYEIAHQTGKWSSNFKKHKDPCYNYDSIQRKINIINEQNSKINLFLKIMNHDFTEVIYENFLDDTNKLFKDLHNKGMTTSTFKNKPVKKHLKKQANTTNSLWLEKFKKDFISINTFKLDL